MFTHKHNQAIFLNIEPQDTSRLARHRKISGRHRKMEEMEE